MSNKTKGPKQCSQNLFKSSMSKKKSLKIPKGSSESVYRRRTENTMAKRKVQKNKQLSTKHAFKTKDRVKQTPLKTGLNSGTPKG
jgi:hypothetical protein